MTANRASIGLIGARGYVGGELIRLLSNHPNFALRFVSSREWEGRALADCVPDYHGALRCTSLPPEAAAASGVDAILLALPNGKAAPYVAAVDATAAQTVLLDLSADYRFDEGWYYGLPELTRTGYRGQRRISNPGCYATAMQLAIAPVRPWLQGSVQCFGVSGYSGAGTTPSDKNDPDKLRDNLMPYSLVEHLHEREVSRQLGHPIEFMPHVAAHFRGLTITANLHLDHAIETAELVGHYRARYADERLITVQSDPPWVSRIAGKHGVELGGFAVSGRRAVVVATLDNLLKGAATQALQNLNRAFGLDELCGVPL